MRKVLTALAFVVLSIGLAATAGYFYLRQSLPQVSGKIEIPGLQHPVQILRDAYGIPHIYAASVEDAYFGLGFVHAQDRLWQMEMSRRIAAGRISEVVGRAGLETDRFLRTLGVRRAAQANVRNEDEKTGRVFEAYAAGVNAFLAGRPVLPPEFWLTGVRPEPWTAVDSVSWMKIMAWDLAGNWRNELLRMRLAKTLPMERIAQFLPPYPGDAPPSLPDLKRFYEAMEQPGAALAESKRTTRANDFLDTPQGEGLGSNSWVVAGSRTASGKPLLANDPHLGLTAPPVWYFAHLHAPGLEVIGATLPGVPAIIVGRTDRIAWGFTNTGPDVQDLFIEKLDPSGKYLTPSGPRAFTVIPETIRVKGGKDEHLNVRISRHGPVLSDVVPEMQDLVPRGHVMALQWTALAPDDRTMEAAVEIGRATDWPSFLAAGRDFNSPQQNVIYADVDGNIGFIAAGKVPIRKPENDLKGLAPAPGWDARYDWAGTIPFDELPRQFNPARGVIVTANQRITPPGYGYPIRYGWEPPYRAKRIEDLLAAVPRHSEQSFARIQADIVSYAARELLPGMLKTEPRSAAGAQALKALAAWDATMAPERPEPLIFVAWWREFSRGVYADELGDAFRRNWLYRPQFLASVLADPHGEALWCDDVRTARRETCAEVLSQSLEAALADLRKRYGADPGKWRWDVAHPAHSTHRPFSAVAWLAPIFDIRVPSPGDAFTIDVGRSELTDEAEPYASRHAPSLRAIYDLSDPQASVFIHSGGQSGNVLSQLYRTFAKPWAQVEYIPMITDRARLEKQGVQRLELVPAAAPLRK